MTGSDRVQLSWKASGDNGTEGQAAEYEVRYARNMTAESFLLAAKLPAPPVPKASGQAEEYLAEELPGSAVLAFGVRVRDAAGNWSLPAISGIVTTLADTIPPAPIGNFRILVTSERSLTLGWVSPGDDSARGKVDHYLLRYSGAPVTQQNWNLAHEIPFSPPIAVAGTEQSAIVSGLPFRRNLTLAIAAGDESGNSSPVTHAVSFALTGGPRSWRILPDRLGDAPTIQAGIDSAIAADSVLVGPGTYHENIDFKGKPITVLSSHGPEVTIIDANGVGPCVKFVTQESRAAVLQGLTLTHGGGQASPRTGTEKHGGGIFCENGSPTIRGNIIRSNSLAERGIGAGGYFGNPFQDTEVADPYLERNTFVDNEASKFGGGCAIVNCNATIVMNTFIRNCATQLDGGAIWCWKIQTVTLEACEFYDNVAGDHGGGVELGGGPNSAIIIRRNLVVRNTAHGRDSPDIQEGAGGGMSLRGATAIVSNNTFVGNDGETLHGSSGGALLLTESGSRIDVFSNIISGSRGYGVACINADIASVHDNLL